ncbi:MAG: hypothetical protein CL569_05695 [Alphaproteobacteria bacterium]|nr:hypothetical protein [Alphaproteobacteria bacterium]
MTDSRADFGSGVNVLRTLSLGCVAISLGVAAHAQVGPPVKLIPGSSDQQQQPVAEEKVVPLRASPQAEVPADSDSKIRSIVQGDGVVVGKISTIDPSSVGLLSLEDGGFGSDMWRGSDRAFVEALIPRLPVQTLSPVMQNLTRRLLLSEARVPAGTPTAPSLLGLRVEMLSASGQTDLVRDLLRLAPSRLKDTALARAEVDSMLLSGNHAGACTNIEALLSDSDDPYWLMGLTFCKALNGESAAAQLGVSLLQEQGGTGDDSFFKLVASLVGDSKNAPGTLIDPSPLHMAMLRAARLDVPDDAVPGARPAILRSIATSPNAPLATRLLAAERAEAAGALSPDALAAIYESVEIPPEDLLAWQTLAVEEAGPLINALLYQVALTESGAVNRARVVVTALSRARVAGGFNTISRVMREICSAIDPTPSLAWAASEIGRALLAAGDTASARRWFDMMHQKAVEQVPDAALAFLDLWPLIQLMDVEGSLGWNPDALLGWWEGERSRAGDSAYERAAIVLTLMDAVGYDVPESLWQELMEASLTVTAYLPSVQLWRALETASQDFRVGETVLLSLLALGEVGPARANPTTLHAVISALRRVGLEADARSLALESALSKGL